MGTIFSHYFCQVKKNVNVQEIYSYFSYMRLVALYISRCSFSMMVKWPNYGLLQANDGKILAIDGEMLVNDVEMSVWSYTHFTIIDEHFTIFDEYFTIIVEHITIISLK